MDTFDCAFMGTSLTARLSATKWMNTLGSSLRLATPRPIQLYDFGVGGQASSYGVAIAPGVAKMRPKAAVIEYGMNDAIPALGISVATFQNNLVSILQSFFTKSPDTRLFLMTMNPVIAPGTSVVPNLAAYYQGLRDVAAAQGVGLIDNTPSWGTPTASQMNADGVHPLPDYAAAVIVPNVSAALLPLI
jgi:lysophospholipase L1-like esterase